MFKTFVILSLLVCSQAFAQDMSRSETFETAYTEMPDGSSRYIGRCTTHEDYQKVYFKTQKVFQMYASIDSLSDLQIKNMIARFDKDLLVQVLKQLDMYDIAGAKASIPEIFRNYIDDFFGETITHVSYPGSILTRVGFGVGGGNGGYMVFAKTAKGHKLLSYTFDGDLAYCDKLVWLNKK